MRDLLDWLRARRVRWIAALAALCSIGLIATTVTVIYSKQHPNLPPLPTAPNMSAEDFDQAVYETRRLMEASGSADQSFAYVSKRSAKEPAFAKECHGVLHAMGYNAFSLLGGYQKAIQYQNTACNSGYTHGVIEAYLGQSRNPASLVATACVSETTGAPGEVFKQWECNHGLGHAIMQSIAKDVVGSVVLCNSLTAKNAAAACINGVFMERFTLATHGGHDDGHVGHRAASTIAPSSINFDECRQQSKVYKSDCYHYVPVSYLTLHADNYTATAAWCHKAEAAYVASCVDGVGAQAMQDNSTNPSVVKQLCDRFSQQDRALCVTGAVQVYVNIQASSDKAAKLCRAEFQAYRAVCESAVAEVRKNFEI